MRVCWRRKWVSNMTLKRSEKEVMVKDIALRFKKAQGIIVAEYSGLKVPQVTELRREVRKADGEFSVLKNRLVKRVLDELEIKGLSEYFKGPVAVAFSHSDPVLLAKVVAKYVEGFEALKLKGGYIGGKVLSPKEIQQLSKLPSKEELYVKLMRTMQAPIQGLLRVLQAVPQKVVVALNGIKDQKQ